MGTEPVAAICCTVFVRSVKAACKAPWPGPAWDAMRIEDQGSRRG